MYRRHKKGSRCEQKTHLVVSAAKARSFDAGDLQRYGLYRRLRSKVSLSRCARRKTVLDTRHRRRSLGLAIGRRWEGLPRHSKRRLLYFRGGQTEKITKQHTIWSADQRNRNRGKWSPLRCYDDASLCLVVVETCSN